MFWSLFTTVCYTISSLGDKYISASLNYKAKEYTFFVSVSTSLWLGLMLIFEGWKFAFTIENLFVLTGLIICKIGELYSSAVILKSISAYELKSWLGLNVILSYVYNVLIGKYKFSMIMVVLFAVLICGIVLIFAGKKQNMNNLICPSKFYIKCSTYSTIWGC